MLARANRVTDGTDYRLAVRRGRRFVAAHTVTYVRPNPSTDSVRFGFIVAKNVGSATRRNLVRRRLKAASFEMVGMARQGTDVVIRALPGAYEASWDALHDEVVDAVNRGAV
ncbi:ribonuclease P protein component [Rathayibacter sp. YIM 133350]|uniref:ribonuclease P protein component n=1 Tax=Rathayibacter sp. YIM 133350 TaxID=3131992 RepID=UPI00307FB5FD